MHHRHHLVLALVAVLGALASGAPPSRGNLRSDLAIRVLGAESCPDVENMAVKHLNATPRMEGRTTVVMDVDFELARPAESISKMVVSLTRCQEAISSNSCKPPEVFVFRTGVCSLLAAPMMPWSSFVDAVKPSYKCPFRKGSYSGRGIVIDLRTAKAVLGNVDEAGAIFVCKGTTFDERGRPIMCMQTTVDIIRVHKRGRD